MPKFLQKISNVIFEKIGFDKDYLHMLMTIPLKYSIASVISKLINLSFSLLIKKLS